MKPAGGAVALRPLAAADRAELVRLHVAAFPDAATTLLGPRYLGALLDAYRTDPGGIALGAFDAAAGSGPGTPPRGLGYVLGSPYGRERARYRRLLPVAAGAFLLRPGLWLRPELWRIVRWRLGSLGRATGAARARELPPPVFLLDEIGVDPSARGRGVGELLMSGFAAAARERGARSLLLWVRREAAPARRLYERCGWREAWPVEPGRIAYRREP